MSTIAAATRIANETDQPSIRWMISASANRFTPEIRTVATANVPALKACAALAEPEAQILRHRANLGAVVERHHHQPQEHHRRHGAQPVVVHGGHAVLGTVGGLAEDLQRPEVGGDERQTGDPGGERAAGEEEVEVGLDREPRDEADSEHHDEVDRQDDVIDRARVKSQHRSLSSGSNGAPGTGLLHRGSRSSVRRRRARSRRATRSRSGSCPRRRGSSGAPDPARLRSGCR